MPSSIGEGTCGCQKFILARRMLWMVMLFLFCDLVDCFGRVLSTNRLLFSLIFSRTLFFLNYCIVFQIIHFPCCQNELLARKITEIYKTTKMASPTNSRVTTLKERSLCSFTGFTLLTMIK
jgi:hypothetical protein